VKTAILRDDIFLAHDTGEGHPESTRRLDTVYRSLDETPIEGTVQVAPRPARREELARVHTGHHIDAVERTANVRQVLLDNDTRTSARSYESALKAAGATVQAVEMVCQGEARGAFALVRPPGHHAEQNHAMGFCLFNNVAVAAAHAIAELGLERVLVLDPDVHHGNGTQHTFWHRPDILYVSSHRYPFYPGTGALNEIGVDEGRGYTINLPLPEGTGDADFLHLFRKIVEPVVNEFRPELILVSAGYDTWMNDPLGGMRQTRMGFQQLYALFRSWADRHCGGRIACTLEGGYDPPGLALCVRTTLEVLREAAAPAVEFEGHVTEDAERVAQSLRSKLAPIWKDLVHART